MLEPDAQIVSHVVRSQFQRPECIQNEAYIGFAQCAYGVYGGRDEALPLGETLKLFEVLTPLLFVERLCSETQGEKPPDQNLLAHAICLRQSLNFLVCPFRAPTVGQYNLLLQQTGRRNQRRARYVIAEDFYPLLTCQIT